LKICVICSGYSTVFGGVETVISELSEYWVKQGNEVYILSGWGKKEGPKRVKLLKLPFISYKIFRKIPFFKRMLSASELEGLSLVPFCILSLICLDPDIVLSNQLSETIPALILKFPSVMISQAPIRLRFKTFNRVDRVIVNDFDSYKSLNLDGIRTQLMFNGVNEPGNRDSDIQLLKKKYGISNNSIIILTIARLDSNKRINLLLDAFSLIKQEATLIIVGEGPELEYLKKQASSIKTGNKIVFVKPLPHDQVNELYQLCDVFTLPSKLEGMPLVLIEALSFGKTVVTNPAPVKKFILDRFGVFSNVEDPIEYSKSLIDALSSKIDINSEEFIQHMNKFQWSKISQQYIETFHEVLSERKSVK